MNLIWDGWRDEYDSSYIPSLINDKNEVVWRGGTYYSGHDLHSKKDLIRKDFQLACERFNITGCDFTSDNVADWPVEDRRKWNQS